MRPHQILAEEIELHDVLENLERIEGEFGHLPGFPAHSEDREIEGKKAWEAYRSLRNTIVRSKAEKVLLERVMNESSSMSTLELVEALKYFQTA